MENETLKLTTEQADAIERLRAMWPHHTSISLRNDTPHGLRVSLNFSLSPARVYSMDSTGDYILIAYK